MNTLPASPNLDHLKKEAKHLLRDARSGNSAALQRFIETLPAVRGLSLAALAQRELKLSDAQSVTAREYGFKSWIELTRFVDWKQADRAQRLNSWLKWVYEGNARERWLAARMVHDEPEFFALNDPIRGPWLACAIGDSSVLRRVLDREPAWATHSGGPLNMPPLVAITRSRLILEPEFEPGLLTSAELLLQQGADVNATWINPSWPDVPASVLYGAAGCTHHIAMTRLLLAAGANPDDNESLYHSVESPDSTCTRLLLAAGARVTGTNALGRVLDYDKLDDLKLMLQHGGDVRERPWIHHAILRGRSMAHIQVLIEAGADLHAMSHGVNLVRYAQLHGRADVVEILRQAGIQEELSEEEQFIAACSRADEDSARAILLRLPEIFSRLTPRQLETMPQLASIGRLDAVRIMLLLGWPREIKSGWGATALNLAVYRGDAQMAELLLQFGADWRTKHGYGDNVLGTLSYASQAEPPEEPAPCDFVGCARALLAHGLPLASLEGYTFAPEVVRCFDSARFNNPHADTINPSGLVE